VGYISGLKDSTKIVLAQFCKRNNITQVAWVDKHLDADLLEESGADKEEEAAN
jgi:hypothetical protein